MTTSFHPPRRVLVGPGRIGLTGESATPFHVRLCVTALAEALSAQGRPASARDA